VNSTVGLTLLRDQPIFINSNYTVDSAYNSEKLLAVSAGIDGALWAVQYTQLVEGENATTKNYPLLKW